MIRRNILAAVAICAALAVGIALGGGPLTSRHDEAAPAAAIVHPDPSLRHAAAFGQKWATQVAPSLYAGRLRGLRIAVVTLPGAPKADVRALRDGLAVAKGTVSAAVTLTPGLLDPNRKVAVDTLGAQYARQSDGRASAARPAYQRLGQMLGVAVAHAPQPQYAASAQGRAETIAVTTARETLQTAKLAWISGGTTPADLVLVVVGQTADPRIVGDLLRGLATKVTGIVVAGDKTSATRGVLAGLRRQKWNAKVMTVDGIDTAYGRGAALAGLVQQTRPRGGSYGASGIDGLVPLG